MFMEPKFTEIVLSLRRLFWLKTDPLQLCPHTAPSLLMASETERKKVILQNLKRYFWNFNFKRLLIESFNLNFLQMRPKQVEIFLKTGKTEHKQA